MTGFGAMLSFEIANPKLSVYDYMKNLELVKPAVSLGGVETTICDPATTSHAKVSADVRNRMGISDGLLRLSVGIEQVEDIKQDLADALVVRG
jgi:cystathionine beta-lyase